MADSSAPNLVVVGGDPKRLQWLNHHITSRWAEAEVTTLGASESAALASVIGERKLDALILQADFGEESAAAAALTQLRELLALHPALYCIVLAEHGNELSAVRSMKSGAKDYLPLAAMTRDQLLTAVSDAAAQRQAAAQAAMQRSALLAPGAGTPGGEPPGGDPPGVEPPGVEVPGYSIVKEIATSNFSSVFLARSERLRRNVVLKVMTRGESERERDDAERFQREYEIISSIKHRAIAEIYDFGSQPHHLYLAMEYFPCGDLRDRMRNPMSVDESLYYLRTIAEALRVIHAVGILHRDLKPANVMLRDDNSPVLIDFGLARRAMEDAGTTGAGQVLGSPYYISPEQAQGQRVDLRTDLYSLGVMFYEMLTGQRPYLGRNAIAVMAQHAHSPVPTLPAAAAAQQPLLERLMAKRQNARYGSADELLADLGPMVAAVA